jgi:hypothetical protein
MPRVLSLCCGMGLMDRAFMDAGFEVVPGCEIDPEQRDLYRQVCGGEVLTDDIANLPAVVRGERFDGVIGGPPCQALTRLKAMREPKFPNLAGAVVAVLDATAWDWFVFENVAPLHLDRGEFFVRLNAMHFATPHQSRSRWFTHTPNLRPPAKCYRGTVDDLMAYSVVAGRIYGPKRAAVLQGWPQASRLRAPALALIKGLANAVHYRLALAWAVSIREGRESSLFTPAANE